MNHYHLLPLSSSCQVKFKSIATLYYFPRGNLKNNADLRTAGKTTQTTALHVLLTQQSHLLGLSHPQELLHLVVFNVLHLFNRLSTQTHSVLVESTGQLE